MFTLQHNSDGPSVVIGSDFFIESGNLFVKSPLEILFDQNYHQFNDNLNPKVL